MEIVFSIHVLDDLDFWKLHHETKISERIRALVKDIQDEPFRGIGKPEPLKYDYAGLWSKRINQKQRIFYEVKEGTFVIHALREHY